MRLLLVEDEEDLLAALAKGLRREGYAVDVASEGVEGLSMLEVEPYDLVILDLGLPGMDGLEVIRRVRREQPALLILVLTARAQLDDRVRGLDLGADDYLTKPFGFEELSARIRALLRRDLRAREPVSRCGDLRLDSAQRVAWQGDRRLALTRKEFAILAYLMRRAGEIVSQEELLDHVWDAQVNPLTNVVPVHINALRRALGDSAKDPRYIRTISGLGYQLVPGESDSRERHSTEGAP